MAKGHILDPGARARTSRYIRGGRPPRGPMPSGQVRRSMSPPTGRAEFRGRLRGKGVGAGSRYTRSSPSEGYQGLGRWPFNT